jgi:diguanylate cyclase (GGDEF)-like protein
LRSKGEIARHHGDYQAAFECCTAAIKMPAWNEVESFESLVDGANYAKKVEQFEVSQQLIDQAQQAVDQSKVSGIVLPQLYLGRLKQLQGDYDGAIREISAFYESTIATMAQYLDERVTLITAQLMEGVQHGELKTENAVLRTENSHLVSGFEQMTLLAKTDPLTGLFNRRALAEHFRLLQAEQRDLALMICDLDHFKSINDRFTHQVGDEVLKSVASILKNAIREGDIVSRIGGEEFVLLINANSSQQAQKLFSRIQTKLHAHDWSKLGTGLEVTMSAGIVVASQESRFDDLLGTADRLLYEAKRSGRNKVVISE